MAYPNTTNLPVGLALQLRNAGSIRNFIETGTRFGVTARTMAPHFEQVHTIELDPVAFERSREALAPLPNVELILGDSLKQLPILLEQIDRPSVIWLDAHWCGDDSARGQSECPVLGELKSIYKHRADHVVFIDDARLFLAPPPRPHDPAEWPHIDQILTFLDGQRPTPVCRQVGDVLVATPNALAGIVSAFSEHEPHQGLWTDPSQL